jgi:hypothetical protein
MLEAIQQLYAAGVDCGVESYQGIGVVAWIVAPGQRRLERSFSMTDLGGIADWLLAEAVSSRSEDVGSHENRAPREILAELAESRRKGPRRVSIDERHARLGKQSSSSQAAG